jgi:hypothetical protein
VSLGRDQRSVWPAGDDDRNPIALEAKQFHAFEGRAMGEHQEPSPPGLESELKPALLHQGHDPRQPHRDALTSKSND